MQLLVSATLPETFNEEDSHEVQGNLPFPAIEADADFNMKKVFPLLQTPLFNKLIGNAQPAAYLLFEKLDRLVARHARYAYTAAVSGVACCLGEAYVEMKGAECSPRRLDRYPLPDVWRAFYEQEITAFPVLLQLLFVLSTNWGEVQSYKVYEFMNREFLPEIKKFYGFDLHGLKKALAKLPHIHTTSAILQLLGEENRDAAYARSVSGNILASFLPLLDKGNARKEFVHETYAKKELRTVFMHQHSCLSYWTSEAFGQKDSEEAFAAYFALCYQLYRKSDYLATRPAPALTKSPLSIFDFAQAHAQGLLPEAEIRRELLTRVNAEESLATASAFLFNKLKPWQRNRLKLYTGAGFAPLKELTARVSAEILHAELERGEERTPTSHLAMKLERIEGAEAWLNILKALDGETFSRADGYHSPNYTRKEVLSHLLRVCYPSETDTTALPENIPVTHERLIEAAIYAPQWLETVEAYTGWKGLLNTACFFHAHINERCNSLVLALIARFTPVRREYLCTGAFDIHWFRRAYREIGARRFGMVMEATGPVSSGNDQARMARCIDAVNGKMDAAAVRKQIEEKRSRDLLMLYGLIPLSKRSNSDLTERYRYFHQLLKESKLFASQRQESEKKAVETGLLNLTYNAGFFSLSRLTWSMETRIFKHIESCFAPREVEGLKVCLKVNGTCKPDIHFYKAGKELIHIPAKMRKEAYVVHLRETGKHLKALYARSQAMLERMMEERIPFPAGELQAFRKNPLAWSWLKHLVFVTQEGETGFFSGEGLCTVEGAVLPLLPSAEVYIAHPVDLRRDGERYQAYLQNKGIVQPLEQVFRKCYAKTEEEREATYSLRHAGEHILPDEIDAALKARRWIPAGSEKWQKVYYREDVVAILETRSEALGPADWELSEVERVVFLERESNRPLPAGNIPDRVFSEIMRDIESFILRPNH
jgi:hypothetical protein